MSRRGLVAALVIAAVATGLGVNAQTEFGKEGLSDKLQQLQLEQLKKGQKIPLEKKNSFGWSGDGRPIDVKDLVVAGPGFLKRSDDASHKINDPQTGDVLVAQGLLTPDQKLTLLKASASKAEISVCKTALKSLRALDEHPDDVLTEELRGEVTTFANACLSQQGVSAIVDPAVAYVALVALVHDHMTYCMGLLIDSGHLVTSRHCFVDKANGELRPYATLLVGFSLDGQRVVRPDNVSSLAIGQFKINKDAVAIPVSVEALPSAPALPSIAYVSPLEDQAAWIAGPVPYLARLSSPDGILGPESWRKGIRFPKWLDGACRITTVNDGCVFHQCQSFEGYSGSPVITYAKSEGGKAKLVWSGVHSGGVGPSAEAWDSCTDAASTPFDTRINVASMIGGN